LRGIANAANAVTPLSVSADSPFIRSLSEHSDALRNLYGCQAADVPEYAILPLADAVGVPPTTRSALPHETVAALHGTLLANPNVRADAARYLSGATPGPRHNALERVVSIASAAWQAPPRDLRPPPPPSVGCRGAEAALRAWLG
jgi:hypothetical protein